MRTASLAGLLVFATPLTAQGNQVNLRVGRALDGRGAVLDELVLVIRDGRIAEIGRGAGPTDYDLRGLTVMPGGIDTHVHIG